MKEYNHKKIEERWQKDWEQNESYKTNNTSQKPKQYILDMFPYPSGAGLHVGHPRGYTATDIYSRFMRMSGHNVLHPMGWDAFGLPAENYAIKTGIHPKESTESNIKNFTKQIKSIGLSYDWDLEINSSAPDYYKFTQWFFLFLYKNGWAYKKKAFVNWDPVDQTVLANEQVLPDGTAERSGAKVEQKELEQWFFKITDFAEELHTDLDSIDWPESTVTNQRNWIGKSEGAEIDFSIIDSTEKIKVFTTRPDTIFGATYLVLAPEHPIMEILKATASNREEIETYQKEVQNKTDLERQARTKEKTGVKLEGIMANNPATQKEIPIFIAEYVLGHYGTGAIMAVPAHDERDFEFAQKFSLPKMQVIEGGEEPFGGDGILTNSGGFSGTHNRESFDEIIAYVKGTKKTTYRLRDWLISRQRYWGAPIPIVYDPEGNPHPIPEEHLPWLLPVDVEFKPHGMSPLRDSKEFIERTEKIFGPGWRPEFDTMDTFVCSSWYFFRFIDPKNEKEFASPEAIKKWLPVDMYVGGAEHTVLHLLYSRFFTKALHRKEVINFNEPFLKLRHQGLILAEDGRKMSKSWGNVINPNEIVDTYGADTLRIYEMFMGPFNQQVKWDTASIIGVRRFIERVYRLKEKIDASGDVDEILLNQSIKKISEDITAFNFNTAISQLMILLNSFEKYPAIHTESYKKFLKILAPFAPFVTEEIWQDLGEQTSIHEADFPKFDNTKLLSDMVTIVIQINGKIRLEVTEKRDGDMEQLAKKIMELPEIKKWTDEKEIVNVIKVQNKLINIVIR